VTRFPGADRIVSASDSSTDTVNYAKLLDERSSWMEHHDLTRLQILKAQEVLLCLDELVNTEPVRSNETLGCFRY
jgi:hypothetical protein